MSFNIQSPHDGSVVCSIIYDTVDEIDTILTKAGRAQQSWSQLSVSQRVNVLHQGINQFLLRKQDMARELAQLIGRPIKQCPGEIEGFATRARYLLSVAEEQLAPMAGECDENNRRIILKEPLGIVLIIGAWNYPYHVVVNTLIPALAAGNAVIIKHAPQTAPVARNIVNALSEGGLPPGLLAAIQVNNEQAERLVEDQRINYVSLVGSPRAGKAVHQAAARRTLDFIRVSLELGGCDGAYVREDADLKKAIPELLEGAFFNSGQSCCGVQRIFAHSKIYDAFLDGMKREALASYHIGDPLSENSTLGPVVNKEAADRFVAVVNKDARRCDSFKLPLPKDLPPKHAYCEPTILINPPVDSHVLTDEVFGPVVSISPVGSDEEAISRINNSPLGLTASIWTRDISRGETMAPQLAVGTVLINRCDTVHPSLPWSGQKLSGSAFSLSRFAYDQVTRYKALNISLD